jgi:hypothetical protein
MIIVLDHVDQQEVDAEFNKLVLDIEDLETLEAPDFWSGFAGVLVGVGAGLIVVGIFT